MGFKGQPRNPKPYSSCGAALKSLLLQRPVTLQHADGRALRMDPTPRQLVYRDGLSVGEFRGLGV